MIQICGHFVTFTYSLGSLIVFLYLMIANPGNEIHDPLTYEKWYFTEGGLKASNV